MEKHFFKERWTRSLIRVISYRIFIIVLDFVAVYLLSGKVETAFWFIMISNIFISAAYFIHERVWDAVNWGESILHNSPICKEPI